MARTTTIKQPETYINESGILTVEKPIVKTVTSDLKPVEILVKNTVTPLTPAPTPLTTVTKPVTTVVSNPIVGIMENVPVKNTTPVVFPPVTIKLPEGLAEVLNNSNGIDFTQIELPVIKAGETIISGAKDIAMDISNGGAIIKPDGTTILMDGVIILPQKNQDQTNVVINKDGSAILPNGKLIELDSLPVGSVVEPKTQLVTLDTKVIGNVDKVTKDYEAVKQAVLNEEVIEEPKGTLSFLDQLTNIIYSLLYKK